MTLLCLTHSLVPVLTRLLRRSLCPMLAFAIMDLVHSRGEGKVVPEWFLGRIGGVYGPGADRPEHRTIPNTKN
ncbi:hypothetical protein GGR57DRAFT_459429 [Xylariaceae sp. FL1272]|nr:hypothetical protein GGR57DRAFT_459429 [Xylariaceae sp. FL1272]